MLTAETLQWNANKVYTFYISLNLFMNPVITTTYSIFVEKDPDSYSVEIKHCHDKQSVEMSPDLDSCRNGDMSNGFLVCTFLSKSVL